MRIINFAIFTLVDYWRSRGVIMELVLACVAFGLFLNGGEGEIELYYIFFVIGLFSVLVAGVSTFRILQRETNVKAYILISKPLKRKGFLLGKMLAALLLVICLDALLLAAALIRNGIPFLENLPKIVEGMLFLLPCAIATITIFTLLSPLVTSPAYILLAIIIVLCGLFNDNVERTFEKIGISPVGHVITWVMPPLGKNIKLSMEYTRDIRGEVSTKPTSSAQSLLLWSSNALYGVIFLALALRIFKRKELTLV